MNLADAVTIGVCRLFQLFVLVQMLYFLPAQNLWPAVPERSRSCLGFALTVGLLATLVIERRARRPAKGAAAPHE